ncbi:MAG TPA: hypothetical protein VFP65_15200, partial [Anaeromyxobacteraceae bacterium]|nr:hypothetical protein [Anaeromyxobacteraceae bacterium]
MTTYLDPRNFRSSSPAEEDHLGHALAAIVAEDWRGTPLQALARWERVLRDDRQRRAWGVLFEKLDVLFRCGKATPLDGPMIGVTMCVRNTDWLGDATRPLGKERSVLARTEWLAALWNGTFANTGLWMGKTFDPVSRETFAEKCGGDPATVTAYDPATARLGRNFFREVSGGVLQELGLPVLTRLWNLRDRPTDAAAPGFDAALRPEHLEEEKLIPYVKTGGYFLSNLAPSVVERLAGKAVYQLNYRWPRLDPVFPMTRLVDEIVQVADGVWLGQLVMASRHFSLGTLHVPLVEGKAPALELGEAFAARPPQEYGYQHNGYFLMIDAALARDAYADDAFPALRPRPGEAGHAEVGGGAAAPGRAPAVAT